MPRNLATPAGAFAGILVGVVVAAVLTFTHATIGSVFPALPEVIRDLNVGVIASCRDYRRFGRVQRGE
jgi:SSS family solute:Na+ symporter